VTDNDLHGAVVSLWDGIALEERLELASLEVTDESLDIFNSYFLNIAFILVLADIVFSRLDDANGREIL